jgi:ketosteroid isomerase-like protein
MKTPTRFTNMLFVISLAFFVSTAGAGRQDAARVAIGAQSRALMQAIEKGDAAAVAELFTADATLSVPMANGPVTGRANIAGFWQAALGGGLKGLTLDPADVIGDGNLRVETGSYRAFGAERSDLGHGQYLLVWVKDKDGWRIGRDFAHPDSSPGASRAADRVGLPSEYAAHFHVLGGTVYGERHGLSTVYANDPVASAANSAQANYPNGSVIVMEYAAPVYDGEEQLLRDPHGQPLKGAIARIDVMRRGAGYGQMYGPSRAGEWEFASYRADGSTLIAPTDAAQCAACHLKAGPEKDFVYRSRSWEPAPGTEPGPPTSR